MIALAGPVPNAPPGAKQPPSKSLHTALQEAVGAGSPHFAAARCEFLSDVAKVPGVSSCAPLAKVSNGDVIHAMSFVCAELMRDDTMRRKSARRKNKRDRDGTAVTEGNRERGGTTAREGGESPQETATPEDGELEDGELPQDTAACAPPQETAAPAAVALPAAGCMVLVDAMSVMVGRVTPTSMDRLAALLASFNGPSGCGGRHAVAFLPRQAYCDPDYHRYFAQMESDGWLFVVDGPPGADDVALLAYSAMYAVPVITNDQFVDHIHAARYNTRLVTDMLLVAADRITHALSGTQRELGCDIVLHDDRHAHGPHETGPQRRSGYVSRKALGQLELEYPWGSWQADRREQAAGRYARCGAAEQQRWAYQDEVNRI